jgi:hypothetical protein
MMRRPTIALLLLVLVLFAAMPSLPAQAAGSGSLTGRAFADANGNGFAEPGESAIAGATVYVQLHGAASPLVVIADTQGVFILTGLDYGMYEVWAAAGTKTSKVHAEVEVAEVNAPVLLDLPLYDGSINKTVEAGLLFLPLLKL